MAAAEAPPRRRPPPSLPPANALPEAAPAPAKAPVGSVQSAPLAPPGATAQPPAVAAAPPPPLAARRPPPPPNLPGVAAAAATAGRRGCRRRLRRRPPSAATCRRLRRPPHPRPLPRQPRRHRRRPDAANSVSVTFVNGSAALPPTATDTLKQLAARRGSGMIAVTGYGDAASNDPDAQSAALDARPVARPGHGRGADRRRRSGLRRAGRCRGDRSRRRRHVWYNRRSNPRDRP